MILTIGLTNFIGAELKTIDGELCVVIPALSNGRVVQTRGRTEVFSEIIVNPSRVGKKYDYSGKLIIPESQRDRVLENPKYITGNRSIAWGYNHQSKAVKSKGGLLSEEDFDRILKDK